MNSNPMLAGNVVALLSPLIFVPVLTFAFGQQHYDWESMKGIRKGDDSDLAASANVDLELVPGESSVSDEMMAEEQHKLKKAAIIARSMTVFLTLSLLILWPMPMYGSGYIFSKKFFTGWIVVGIMWLFFSSFCVGLFPLWEGRHSMAHTVKSMWLDATGKRKPALHGRHGDVTEGESPEGAATPDEKAAVKGE